MLTRMAGTPVTTYGVEIVGMSDTHLQDARGAIARGAAPQGGGKNPDLVLRSLDAGGGTLDPAFDAHVLPGRAYAWWQHWQPAQALQNAVAHAIIRLSMAAGPMWQVVAGLVATLVASAPRLGWTFASSTVLVDDVSEVFDFTLDRPIVLADAARRSVWRWRFKRVCALFPDLEPQEADFVAPSRPRDDKGREWDNAAAPATLLDMSDAIGRLLRPGARKCKLVERWEPADAAYLLSATSGGQWPQKRLTAMHKGVDDARCQLCLQAPGTLLHRHECDKTRPF